MTLFAILDYASVFVFALTGSLVASRAQLDIVGFLFFANLTAVGGGTLRDVILDRNPVFWVADPSYVGVASVAALLAFLTAHLFESRYSVLLWLDAFALAIAVAAGSGVAQALGHSAPVVLVMGVITGCMGGLMRDVVSNEVPLVLKQGELYVTCAFAGSAATTIAYALELSPGMAAIACAGVTVILRAGSMSLGWCLPVYKSRPQDFSLCRRIGIKLSVSISNHPGKRLLRGLKRTAATGWFRSKRRFSPRPSSSCEAQRKDGLVSTVFYLVEWLVWIYMDPA